VTEHLVAAIADGVAAARWDLVERLERRLPHAPATSGTTTTFIAGAEAGVSSILLPLTEDDQHITLVAPESVVLPSTGTVTLQNKTSDLDIHWTGARSPASGTVGQSTTVSLAVGDVLVLKAVWPGKPMNTKSVRIVAQPGTSYGTRPSTPPDAATLTIGALSGNSDIQVPATMTVPPGGEITLTNTTPFTVDWSGAVSPANGQLHGGPDSVTLSVAPGGYVTLSPYSSSSHIVRFVAR
jgi:hypothetical protein